MASIYPLSGEETDICLLKSLASWHFSILFLEKLKFDEHHVLCGLHLSFSLLLEKEGRLVEPHVLCQLIWRRSQGLMNLTSCISLFISLLRDARFSKLFPENVRTLRQRNLTKWEWTKSEVLRTSDRGISENGRQRIFKKCG